ncbi:hypothetical protein [Spirosoma endbachense]|uniref:Uncharacterized protein n=1 Tax=Spirosoma endbachense TaxID=2666025 RepID=A0A6P1VX88_9BACT|nr:hypothetical protein [Spirosoma endbachense]QHV96309.1 hypothetical protein GJR95_15350 [Spirosoma endbachense]
MKRERLLLTIVNILLFCAGMLLCQMAQGQSTIPMYANQDPGYWYNLYQEEQARANGLEVSGKTSIDGLKASLSAANDTIIKQNATLVRLVKERNGQTDRAVKAEIALKPVRDELAKYEGKTNAGKAIRKVSNALTYIGGGTVLFFAIKAAVP